MGHGADSVTDHDPRWCPDARAALSGPGPELPAVVTIAVPPAACAGDAAQPTRPTVATSPPSTPRRSRRSRSLDATHWDSRNVKFCLAGHLTAVHRTQTARWRGVARKWQLTVQQLDIARLTIDWMSTQDLPPWGPPVTPLALSLDRCESVGEGPSSGVAVRLGAVRGDEGVGQQLGTERPVDYAGIDAPCWWSPWILCPVGRIHCTPRSRRDRRAGAAG